MKALRRRDRRARELFLSGATVQAHVSRSLTTLDATNRVRFALLAHDGGLAEGSVARGGSTIGPPR